MSASLREVFDACVKQVNAGHRHIQIVIPAGSKVPRKAFPRPIELLCASPEGERVYLYDPLKVLAALVAHGYAEVAPQDRDSLKEEA